MNRSGYDAAPVPRRARPLVVGVVHTVASPCRCHASILPGLRALGHQGFSADADALPLGLARLVAADAVFEQTDTLRGEGWMRPFVRAELERAGVAVVGPSASACALADDKVRARERMAAAGVPVARGAAFHGERVRLPATLRPPFVVKAAHEHGSRGLVYAGTRAEAEPAARGHVPRGPLALVEEYVEGIEVTVSLVGAPLRPLPPVLVRLPSSEGPEGLHTFARKWTGFPGTGAPAGRLVLAALPGAVHRRLLAVVRRATKALGLTFLARLDVRLRADGEPVVLEANPRPSLERGAAAAVAAAAHGWSYEALLARLLADRLGAGRRR